MAETFLSREEWACPGEESRKTGVASQTVEAQPVFGQIKPSKRRGVRVLNNIGRRRDWHRSYDTRGRFVFRWEKREHVQEGRIIANISAPVSRLLSSHSAPRV